MAVLTEIDLKQQLKELHNKHPKLKDDELFVAWFVACSITDTEEQGVLSLVGGAGDKSLDAIYIDDGARKVFLVQGKYREKLGGGNEKRSDVMAFASLAGCFYHDEEFSVFIKGLAPAALGKVVEARKRIDELGYQLQLYYVTTGKVSEGLFTEAQKVVKMKSGGGLEVFDGKKVIRLLSDYLDGVAPPVPMLEFELENGEGITTSSVLQRFDRSTGIASWVVPVTVSQVAALYARVGVRLFARNVRGFLGQQTEVNQSLKTTLDLEPECFWYFNNGITIVCDQAEKVSQNGRELLRLFNPQIINGQQTTRILHEHASKVTNAAVMVRVISVPRATEEDTQRFENLVSKIVSATNWQNKISASDLKANDRLQIILERNLRNLGYQYLRKHLSKGEAKRLGGGVSRYQITKEELAQVSAACQLDPVLLRKGKEHFFGEDLYPSVFPNTDAEHYLSQHWLSQLVKYQARGIPERSYMKWLTINFLWRRLGPLLTRKSQRETFRILAERKSIEHLPRAIEAAFKAMTAFFRANCGTGDDRMDASNYFNHKGLAKQFDRFWHDNPMGHMTVFDRAWAAFEQELSEAEEA